MVSTSAAASSGLQTMLKKPIGVINNMSSPFLGAGMDTLPLLGRIPNLGNLIRFGTPRTIAILFGGPIREIVYGYDICRRYLPDTVGCRWTNPWICFHSLEILHRVNSDAPLFAYEAL